MEIEPGALARNWLKTSLSDLEVGREIASRWPEVACFHAQQCCEKALKAIIVAVAGDAARTHLITSLLDELEQIEISVPSDIVTAAAGLGKYYMPTRYPDALGGMDPRRAFTPADAQNALDDAQKIYAFAEDAITS